MEWIEENASGASKINLPTSEAPLLCASATDGRPSAERSPSNSLITLVECAVQSWQSTESSPPSCVLRAAYRCHVVAVPHSQSPSG